MSPQTLLVLVTHITVQVVLVNIKEKTFFYIKISEMQKGLTFFKKKEKKYVKTT